MAVCLGSFIAFVCACCAIFIICWFKIGQRLRDIQTTDGSHPNYSFQYKLFILLSLQVRNAPSENQKVPFQTCMPIAFNIFPAAICFILSLAKVDAGDLPYVCAMIITFAQICDPIFTIFFIAEYKNFFTRCLHKVGHTRKTGNLLLSRPFQKWRRPLDQAQAAAVLLQDLPQLQVPMFEELSTTSTRYFSPLVQSFPRPVGLSR